MNAEKILGTGIFDENNRLVGVIHADKKSRFLVMYKVIEMDEEEIKNVINKQEINSQTIN